MSLIRLVWGGNFYTIGSGGTAVEEWSCSLSLIGPVSPDPAGQLVPIVALVKDYHTAPATHIDSTCALEWIKLNEFDPVTGAQMTDPTIEETYLSTSFRGADSPGSKHPISAAYRVSIGALTRDRTQHGGWFVPRPGINILGNGRYALGDVQAMTSSAEVFVEGINAGPYTVGVWSRKNGSVTTVSRLKVGDVPDNISRRRNALQETYTEVVIT